MPNVKKTAIDCGRHLFLRKTNL